LKKNKQWNPKYLKGKKKKLTFLSNKLAKYQSKTYLPVHFGKNSLKETNGLSKKKIQERYRKSRMELSIDGSAANKGNAKIRIEYSNSTNINNRNNNINNSNTGYNSNGKSINTGYQLKFFY